MSRKVPIIMGSEKDLDHVKKISSGLEKWNLPFEYRVASAHKHPAYLLQLIHDYDNSGLSIVYVTVAGRSDGLSATASANTPNPVVACPPYSEKYGGASVFSTFYVPSKSCPMLVEDPANVGDAVAKIYALSDSELREQLIGQMKLTQQEIEEADRKLRSS